MMPESLVKVLGGLPPNLRSDLVQAFNGIINNYHQNRWEPAELNGGKLCEVIYSIIRGQADGAFPQHSRGPRNMVDDCRALARETGLPRSLRIQVPRMMIALYEVRNNRGVGHVGGDVNPSRMDAMLVVHMAKWLMAELVRVFHDVDTVTASEAVEMLIEREVDLLWSIDGKKRVLDDKLSLRDRTLLLLYSESGKVGEAELLSWVEAADTSAYRRNVLRKCHKEKLLEYDSVGRGVHISPKGRRYVEECILRGRD